MAYTVLARRYRSRTFEEVVGQTPIATTLVNAIKAGRVHHGYLFTGTRGVGKTSMARILAKALNCLQSDAPTPAPCCECEACRAIAEGQDIDVIEIDAASNTGVDNIRELRSNAAFRPARSRFKVYIIDEVHMLSTGAFNALLKTLEEPPDHVKFILATTESQKVPATIRSRCQCFTFRNIDATAIQTALGSICRLEGAHADPAAIRRIARLANGSMRDALSILDQLLSVSPGELTSSILDEILPPVQNEQVFALIRTVADADVRAALEQAEQILGSGSGVEVFCNDAIELLHSLMMIRVCGIDAPGVDVPASERGEYSKLAASFELSQFVQMIAMFEELRRNVRFSGTGRAQTDALLVRIARIRAWAPIETLIEQLSATDAGGVEKKKPQPEQVTVPARDDPPQVIDLPRAGAPQSRSFEIPVPPRGDAAFSPERADDEVHDVARLFRDAPGYASEPYGPAAPLEALETVVPAGPEPDRAGSGSTISPDLRARALSDPVVKDVIDLFGGVLTNARPAGVAPEPDEVAE